jgi:polyisoprenoid-binding protein YceI
MKKFIRTCLYGSTVLTVFTLSSFILHKGVPTKFTSQNVEVVYKGTSTLHDWEMKSKKGKCEGYFVLDANDKLTAISSLNFSVDVESFKSEYRAMDNNTYKAMNTKQFKNITFELLSCTITQTDANNYQVKSIGNLTIAGYTKKTDVNANIRYSPADKGFTVWGSKSIKMTDWKVTPPTAVFGTIKTGDGLVINYVTKVIR